MYPSTYEKNAGQNGERSVGSYAAARWGHVATTALLMAIGIGYGVTGWIAGDTLNIQLTDTQRVAVIFHIFVYILLILIAIYGIFTAIANRARRARYVAPLLLAQLPFSIASGAFILFIVFHPSAPLYTETDNILQTDFDRCSALMSIAPNDGFLKQMCERTPLIKGLCIGLLVFGWLFQLFAAYISSRYASKLREVEGVSEKSESKDEADLYC